MYKKLVEALRDFSAKNAANAAVWTKTREELEKNYNKSGDIWAAKYKEGKELFDRNRQGAEAEALKAIEEVFAECLQKVKSFATEPVPEDFPATMEAIKAIGDSMSEKEAKMYFEKYQSNYLAARGIANFIHKTTGLLTPLLPLDKILEQIEADHITVVNYVKNFDMYHRNTYTELYYTNEKPENNYWMKAGKALDDFVNGNMKIVAEPIEG